MPLQADNLLVDESGRVLLADFGATAQLERQEYHAGLVAPRPGGASPSASDASLSDRDGSAHSSSLGDLVPQVRLGCAHEWAACSLMGSADGSLLAAQRASSSWSKYLSRNTFVGTPYAMAPEVMLESDEG
jgi:serine/threonine protein kinase